MSDHASSMLRLAVSLIFFIIACTAATDMSSQVSTALELRSQQEEYAEGRLTRIEEARILVRIKGTQVIQGIRVNLQDGIPVQVDGTKYNVYSDPLEPDVSALNASSLYSMYLQRNRHGEITSVRFEQLKED